MAIVRRNDPFRDLVALQDQLFRTFDAAYRGNGREDEQSMAATWTPQLASARRSYSAGSLVRSAAASSSVTPEGT